MDVNKVTVKRNVSFVSGLSMGPRLFRPVENEVKERDTQ